MTTNLAEPALPASGGARSAASVVCVRCRTAITSSDAVVYLAVSRSLFHLVCHEAGDAAGATADGWESPG